MLARLACAISRPSARAFSTSSMTASKVLVTRGLPEQGKAALKQAKESGRISELIEWPEDRACDRTWLLEHAKGCNGLLVMLNDKIDQELLDAAGQDLKVVSSYSAGFDHVALPVLKERNIRLGFTPDALTDACADLSVMLALMASRLGGVAMRRVLQGDWPSMPWSPLLLTGQSFTNKTIGFLGFGRIAQATLVRMMPYAPAKAIYSTSQIGKKASQDYYSLMKEAKIPIEPAQSIDQIAKESDVLFVCCALTPQTKNLVDERFLSLMKPTSVIVNTARGPVVDSDALAKALKEERLLGAGLDVLTNEPNIGADHPLACDAVLEPRAVVLPHIASATVETRGLMAEEAVKNLLAGLEDGKMINEKAL